MRFLRDWIASIQKVIKEGNTFSSSLETIGNLPEVNRSHEFSANYVKFLSEAIEPLKINMSREFFRALQRFVTKVEVSTEPLASFSEKIGKLMPKTCFTQKGMLRIKKEILKKLKTYYLWFRKSMDEESVQFYRDFHMIFFQPEKLTPERIELLESFLTAHYDLTIYREMSLLLGELSRLPPKDIDGHQIDDLCENSFFSKKLNTAIKTIKKHKEHILRFVEYFTRHPELLKAQCSTMEYRNKKFKQPFEAGNNLLKKERVLGKVKHAIIRKNRMVFS